MMIMEHSGEKCVNKCMVKRGFPGMKRNYGYLLVLFHFGGFSSFSSLNIDSFVNVSGKTCHKREIFRKSVNFVNDTTALKVHLCRF